MDAIPAEEGTQTHFVARATQESPPTEGPPMRYAYSLISTLALIGCLVGCAGLRHKSSAPEPEVAGEYQIPVVKRDGHIEQFTVDPTPDSTMLICIEGDSEAVCIANENGQAQQYVFPLGKDPKPQPGARWDGMIIRPGDPETGA